MAFAQRTRLLMVFFLIVTAVPPAYAATRTVKIEQANIRKVLNNYLQTQQKRYPHAQIRLREIQRVTPFHIPAGHLRWEVTPSSRRLFDSRRFNLILRSNGTVVKNMTLFVDLEALAPVAVAAADLPRGTILNAEDLTMVTMDLASLRAPCFDAQQMVGKKLRRPVRMGAPFTQTGLETPPLIKRGDMVTITASVGALTVTARGLAQQNGAAEETIRVKNIRSQKEIFCRVTAPSAVEVEL